MEAAPDPKDATDFRFRQLSKVKLVSDGGNEAIINPAENSQRLAISNKLGLVFAGKSGVPWNLLLYPASFQTRTLSMVNNGMVYTGKP